MHTAYRHTTVARVVTGWVFSIRRGSYVSILCSSHEYINGPSVGGQVPLGQKLTRDDPWPSLWTYAASALLLMMKLRDMSTAYSVLNCGACNAGHSSITHHPICMCTAAADLGQLCGLPFIASRVKNACSSWTMPVLRRPEAAEVKQCCMSPWQGHAG